MPFTDGYQTITPTGTSPKSAPGTEKTNEAREKPGPAWAKADNGGGGSAGGSTSEE